MLSKDEILQMIYLSIDEINPELPGDEQIEKVPSAALAGEDGKLDSLEFINFIMATEKRLRERLGKTVTLVTQEASSSGQSPFETVDALADYIGRLTSGDK